MTGPLMQLFARIQAMPPAQQYEALQRMSDPGGPIILGGPPSIRGFEDAELPQRMPVDEYVSRRPMAFRDPAQGGPQPPSRQALSALFEGKR